MHSNHLTAETSPYLLQHSHNPIDWYPWGSEALNRAKIENKPIFLSIGYSACHWCHVMEKDSFEDESIAEFMNEHFIAIKVDREERPDVDHIYMTALQTMTGAGGWPLSMFLTPNGEPFYGGTYFPKQDQQGRAGFFTILHTIAHHWHSEEGDIIKQSRHLTQHIKAELDRSGERIDLPSDLLKRAVEQLDKQADKQDGGFFSAPKFPHSLFLELYIDALTQQADLPYQEHLLLSLHKMAEGGIYDQVGGGFHRYSTDGQWLVPHFEKMLYDNALLAKCYLRASQVIDKDFNLCTAKDILSYISEEMTHPDGGFYSASDADSDGVEGKFFVWTQSEVKAALNPEDAKMFCHLYGITADGLPDFDFPFGTPPHHWFEGRVAHLQESVSLPLNIDTIRKRLKEYRSKHKTAPFRDEKILLSWNALMSTTYSLAYEITGDPSYLKTAKANAIFILKNLRKDKVLHTSFKDSQAKHLATLEDYAYFIESLLALHRAGVNDFIEIAKELVEEVVQNFSGNSNGAFYFSSIASQDLILRSKNIFDHALPSANAVLAKSLIYLGRLCGHTPYLKLADGIFHELSSFMLNSPQVAASYIQAYEYRNPVHRELVLMGADRDLYKKVLSHAKPWDIIVTEQDTAYSPLLKGKTGSTKEPTLYICQNQSCLDPVLGEKAILTGLSHQS